jgi:hypothetical protein
MSDFIDRHYIVYIADECRKEAAAVSLGFFGFLYILSRRFSIWYKVNEFPPSCLMISLTACRIKALRYCNASMPCRVSRLGCGAALMRSVWPAVMGLPLAAVYVRFADG